MLEMLRRRRRPIGVGLTGYGLLGLTAGILVVAATIAVGVGMEPALSRVDRQRDVVVASLERSAAALARTAGIIEATAGAVENASAIAAEGADVSRRVADTLTRLGGTFGSFDILGRRPFEPLASDASELATQLRGVAADTEALADRMTGIAGDLPPLAADVRATSTGLATVASELGALEVPEAATTAFGWLVLGIVCLVAWLLVPAVVSLIVGVALLRGPPATTAEPAGPA